MAAPSEDAEVAAYKHARRMPYWDGVVGKWRTWDDPTTLMKRGITMAGQPDADRIDSNEGEKTEKEDGNVVALIDWFKETAQRDGEAVVPKAVEYGSRDLIEMGHSLARAAGRTVDDAEATEMGIWFYALGKMARWSAAVARGERASDDTLLDLNTYAMMARRVRAVGGWPGVVL